MYQKTQKKSYLTWRLIEQKQEAIANSNFDLSKQLTREIRNQARKDKERSLLDELEEVSREGYKWEGLQKTRKTFNPKRLKFRDRAGTFVKEKDFPEAAAEYFAEVQGAEPLDNDLIHEKENTPLIEGHSNMKDDAFIIQELDEVMDAQKNNKSAGPDGCRAELVKWLNNENRSSLLELYNDVLQNNIFPESFKKANLVAVYKKGDATQMQNYRPIAFLPV